MGYTEDFNDLYNKLSNLQAQFSNKVDLAKMLDDVQAVSDSITALTVRLDSVVTRLESLEKNFTDLKDQLI